MSEPYSNVNIIETVNITPEGKIVKVFRISARTLSGVSFTEEVPATEFTEEKVKKVLTAKAKLIESIKGI
jgi:hypothetical protein